MRKALVIALVAAVVAVAAYYWRSIRTTAEPAILTSPVTRGDVVETIEATGTLKALTTVQVGTQVSGTIKALRADFNSRVRRGQVIAELDPALFETQVAQAAASVGRLEADAMRAGVQIDDAQRKLRRAKELFDQELIARADLEAAEMTARQADLEQVSVRAQIAQARASLQQAQVNLAHTVITAPIDGIVISRNVDVGQTVAASMQAPTLFVLARDLTRMQVNASIAESDIGRVHAGQPVAFRVDAYSGRTFPGVVTQVRLDPVVEQNVVSYVTTIDVANPDLLLKPGMTATVSVETARADNVVRIPNAALRVRIPEELIARLGSPEPESPAVTRTAAGTPDAAEGGESRQARGTTGASFGRPADVWVLADGRLRRVPVLVGVSDGRWTALADGELPEGAAVVTSVASDGGAAGPSPAAQSPLLPQRRGGAGGNRGTAPR